MWMRCFGVMRLVLARALHTRIGTYVGQQIQIAHSDTRKHSLFRYIEFL
jgi:hypothetical protein